MRERKRSLRMKEGELKAEKRGAKAFGCTHTNAWAVKKDCAESPLFSKGGNKQRLTWSRRGGK